ncbi:ribokinase [Paenibacillus marchantiophytorum]|uniref:Ribokinase n=1 Tax=Paenibacillus marchantiophytorum TaxID=1619310 RepID=A0ABQ2BU42_9BACL|nr:ribokinase [Paenibacillus marchantiophytorum]GGI46377.1 ribokinase [Paenibacillus marchantiophytorum]
MVKILVIGSINMDVVNHVLKHPLPGETIKSIKTDFNSGGKGANQAAAAALAGAQVTLIGAVGNDPFASQLLSAIREMGIQSDFMIHKVGNSGLASITIDASGENHIILSEGANGLLTVSDIQDSLEVLDTADIVLLQNEINWDTTRYVMEESYKRGISVYFNPAPALQIPLDILHLIDVLILNETEAESLTGIPVSNDYRAVQASAKLINGGVGNVVLTLGKKGSMFTDSSCNVIHVPSFDVQVVDTTAAGDTFIGFLAALTGSKEISEEALRFASAAAAIKITRKGALEGIPNKSEVEAFLTATTSMK